MLERAFAAGVPAAWVTGDEIYGDATDLRRWLEQNEHPYVFAVSRSSPVWHAGRQERADVLVASLSPESWGTLSCGAGSQGERLYDWACIQLPYERASGMAHWLLARRNRSDPKELAYFRAFGPETTALEDLVRVAGTRWAIEESFEDAKGVVGLDQYEVRKWNAWYRHVTLALLAHAYLEVTRREAAAGEKGGQQTSSP
jgi:SRSO17 transposase